MDRWWLGRTTPILIFAFVLAACGSSQSAPSSSPGGSASDAPVEGGETVAINLGISPFQDTMLPIIGEQKGWFEEADLDVELTTLSWDAVMTSVASEAVDVAINNTTGVVSVANRAPEVIYWYGWNPFTQGSALMGRPEVGLKTLEEFESEGLSHEDARTATFEQLEGRTIVTTVATDMGKQVRAALDSVGLSEDDVDLVDLDPDQGLAAFLSGTGDAYLGGIPQRQRATDDGMLVIASGPDLAPPPINGFVTTTTFAEENEDAMLRLMNVMFRIVRYCDENTADCGEIITTEINERTGAELTVADFENFWQNFELYAGNAAEVDEMILSEDGIAYWKATWDGDNAFLFEETEQIPAAVDPADHFWGERIQEKYVERYGADESGS